MPWSIVQIFEAKEAFRKIKCHYSTQLKKLPEKRNTIEKQLSRELIVGTTELLKALVPMGQQKRLNCQK
jgi:hypothetical protein